MNIRALVCYKRQEDFAVMPGTGVTINYIIGVSYHRLVMPHADNGCSTVY